MSSSSSKNHHPVDDDDGGAAESNNEQVSGKNESETDLRNLLYETVEMCFGQDAADGPGSPVANSLNTESATKDENTDVANEKEACEETQREFDHLMAPIKHSSKTRLHANDEFNTQMNPFLIDPSKSFPAYQSQHSNITKVECELEDSSMDAAEEGMRINDTFAPSSNWSKPSTLFHEDIRCGLMEPTASVLEREILLRSEISDKRAKILQLPSENMPASSSHCEKEIVGDDAAKTAVDILCECGQPSMTGGAVPVVTSLNLATDANTEKNDFNELKLKQHSNNAKINLGRSKARPSLIPKLSSTFRSEKSHSSNKSEGSHSLVSASHAETESVKKNPPRNICFSPEEKVDQVTLPKNNKNEREQHEEQWTSVHNKQKHYRTLSREFSKYISRLAEEASNLSELNDPNTQLAAVDNLYQRIIILKKIGNELKACNNRVGTEPITSKKKDAPKSTESTSKNKENNRIHIKFLPTKTAVKKKKFYNILQTEPATAVENPPEQEISKMQLNADVEAKEVDSMDGMFIPSFDEPPKIEDDEDEDGLDITITFPELQKAFNQNDSHLSVCFSSISAEALGHLKRCPKEFTLRMDFIQGKMFFQSGKSPANNYAIGPDLKITECPLESKQSDVISIKPPTECLYASQIIPVEGATQKESLKILKSTDSELFKVVGLSDVSKRRSSAATKSCITFKNLRRFSSESSFAGRALCKSMPQIPSLIRILEEPDLESVVSGFRTAMINAEKKPRNRILQKKRNNASLNSIFYDVP